MFSWKNRNHGEGGKVQHSTVQYNSSKIAVKPPKQHLKGNGVAERSQCPERPSRIFHRELVDSSLHHAQLNMEPRRTAQQPGKQHKGRKRGASRSEPAVGGRGDGTGGVLSCVHSPVDQIRGRTHVYIYMPSLLGH